MADWPPKKNGTFTVSFPIYDNDGDLVTGAAALDSEVSIDGAGFTDCTNEAGEDGTSGTYDLVLTAGEMNGDRIKVITKTTTPNAKTAVNVMYTATRQLVDLAFPVTSGRGVDVDASGGVEVGSFQAGAITAAAIATDAIDADALADGAITAAVFAAGAVDAAAIANGAIDAATFAAGAIDNAAFNVTETLTANPAAGGISNTSFAAGAIDAAAIAPDAIGSSEFAQAAADKIWASATRNLTALGFQLASADFTAGFLTASLIATGAVDADALATDAINEIADGLMTRASSNWEASAPVKSLGTAVMKAVHRLRDNAGALEIYRSDGTTVHASQTVTTDAAAEPIDELTGAV